MWLTRLALKYPVSTTLFALTIVVFGFVSFTQLPIDLLPNISIPRVSVITYYTGASPMDMEQSVTTAIERGTSSVNDVDYSQSSTREGVSRVVINFNWEADLNVALVDVVQRIGRILTLLPTGVQQPISLKFDITQLPVCTIAVNGDMDERELFDLAFNTIEPQIEHLSGVASAQVLGGKIREVHVTINRQRLEALKLPVATVFTAVANANLILPSGDLKYGTYDYTLKTESQFNVVRPMQDIVITVINGVPIRVRDIGTVEDSFQEQTEIVRVNGKPGVTLRVQKLANSNSVQVVDNVLEAIPKLTGIPNSVKMTLSFDQSVYIRQTISGLQREAMLGAGLAMVVILLFLRNIRGTLIIIVAIPLSILITFIYFRFGGITLNIMTFGGLALAVGRLVDDSIVELEAISRHYTERQPGQSKMDATLAAAKEVAAPIFISTLTTVIVFLPIVFLNGIPKLLFIPLTVTITVALFGSFFVSRSVTPLLCLKFLPPEKALNRGSSTFSDRVRVKAHDWLEGLDNGYESWLRSALRRKGTVIGTILVLALLSTILFKFIGTEFFPDPDEGQFTVTVKMPVGTRVEDTEKETEIIEGIIREHVPELQAIINDIGVPAAKSGNFFGANSGEHAASVQVALVPSDERKRSLFEVVNELRPILQKLPGVQTYISPSGFLRFLLNFGSNAPIDVEVRGYDLQTGSELASQIAAIVRATPGATDVLISREENLPELSVRIDRDKAGTLGINVADVSNTINTCMNGSVASLFTDPVNGNEYNILVRLSENYRTHLDDLRHIVLTTSHGDQVELGNVATIVRTAEPVEIDRKLQQRLIEVTANNTGRDLGSVADDIRAGISKIAIPQGFEVVLTGAVEQQKKSFQGLLLAGALALILVFVVMASQFQSLLDPFIIMFTVPLGMVGVLWMLFLTGTTLSMTSAQGIIVMVGIVVSNGILLVDYTNHLRIRGLSLEEAVVTGSRTRLKPILMTSIATVLGLIPMAIGLGGEQTQAPLAISVIGGLTVSTILTLFFVPLLYTVIENWSHRAIVDHDAEQTQDGGGW